MTYNNVNELYNRLVCEDPANIQSDETTKDDTLPVIMCIDTSGWNPSITITDTFEITKK
jgi:hypothetical protein